MLEDELNSPVFVAEYPEMAGALGAATYLTYKLKGNPKDMAT